MSIPLYYAVRVTTPTARGLNIERKVVRVMSVAELNDITHDLAPLESKVETKYLGSGEPIHKSNSPLGKRFHTVEQLKSYDAGLMGHGLYPMDMGPLDNFNYLGEQDAEILWDTKRECAGDEE